MARRDVYQEVADAIITKLDEGVVPWRQPWLSMRAMSASTRKPYRGINTLLLAIAHQRGGYVSPYWGTYRKINEVGGQIRKGEKSTMVTFWKLYKRETDTGEEKVLPFLRSYNVFNVEQADWPNGLPEKYAAPAGPEDPIIEAEAVILRYTKEQGLKLGIGGDSAYYAPLKEQGATPTVQDVLEC